MFLNDRQSVNKTIMEVHQNGLQLRNQPEARAGWRRSAPLFSCSGGKSFVSMPMRSQLKERFSKTATAALIQCVMSLHEQRQAERHNTTPTTVTVQMHCQLHLCGGNTWIQSMFKGPYEKALNQVLLPVV